MLRKSCYGEFVKAFGGEGEIRAFFAPLRLNLIGEYTDIAGGLVLPCAIDPGIFACARKREDKLLRLRSADTDFQVSVSLEELHYDKEDGWGNYPKGVLNELLKLSDNIGGADIYYMSTATELMAAGLSSSAAIEVLTAVVINELFGLGLDGRELALAAQRAENDFVGVKCGIMDQYAVMLGKKEHALLLDCSVPEHTYIPARLEESGLSLVIMNSNKKRGLLDSQYNERRRQADRAFEIFVEAGLLSEEGNLCAMAESVFEARKDVIADEVVRKRAGHIVSENGRVKRAALALENGDFAEFGRLLNQSHKSLKEDFQVTGKELDSLQAAAVSFGEGCLGARMTGAGFGGCALAIICSGDYESFTRFVGERYFAETGLKVDFYACRAGRGAGEL